MAQRSAWSHFAARFPRKARVLDLASGDGRVMGWLLGARGDIRPLGIDQSERLPPAPRGAKLRDGVAMEAMPFPDDSFDGVTAQFGFEYGDVALIAREIARVVKAGAPIGLMVHRGDGPILAHNVSRRAAIAWAIEERALVDTARRALAARAMTGVAVPPALAQAPAEGARAHGEGSASWEIAEAVRRIMGMGARDDPTAVRGLLDRVEAQARNEMARIASLEAACATADDHASMERAFNEAGLILQTRTPLVAQGEARPFADFLDLTA